MKCISYPRLVNKDGKKMWEIGDGTFRTQEEMCSIKKSMKEKCPECGHLKSSHYGKCRWNKGLSVCLCQKGYWQAGD